MATSEMERTFIAVKPDGVQRGLIHKVIEQFEQRGFTLRAIKMIQPNQRHLIEQHYAEHKGKSFLPQLVDFMTSAPLIAMVWEGENVVAKGRQLIGATNPANAAPGTLRGDYCIQTGRNLVHGSDSVVSAKREIDLWFSPSELCEWKPAQQPWLYEK